jgi:single-strand DNA-binding protein
MNKVIVRGNLTRDPEMRYTPSGVAVTNFSLAVNEGYGENKKTTFLDVVVWGSKDKPGAAAAVADNLTKGSSVLVSGRLQSRNWEAQDGTKRKAIEIVADSFGGVEFLDSKEKRQGNSSPSHDENPFEANDVDPDEIPF